MNYEKLNRISSCTGNKKMACDSLSIKASLPEFDSNIESLDIFDDLVNGITNKDYDFLNYILHENGKFEIQNDSFETIVVQKSEFLSWFFAALSITEISSIKQDQCLNCKFSNPVLLINEGYFPKKVISHVDPIFTGLMYEVEENKISRISFCYSFVGKENESKFQFNINRIMELEEAGISKKDAFFQVLGYYYNEENF